VALVRAGFAIPAGNCSWLIQSVLELSCKSCNALTGRLCVPADGQTYPDYGSDNSEGRLGPSSDCERGLEVSETGLGVSSVQCIHLHCFLWMFIAQSMSLTFSLL